jgi:hypothetical protein
MVSKDRVMILLKDKKCKSGLGIRQRLEKPAGSPGNA